ncbi:MAG TPA: PQQ-like beta-propeller repeat protein, partial [Pirellulaceae bacterium]|nr:PQQ-like beta-propeller repeat protein [Pirellulaceae bacterium]
IPVVKFRWTPSADKLLSGPVVDGSLPEVDLASDTEGDFPEFLGPGRTASVERPLLERDWSASPPKVLWRRPIGAGWSAFSAVNGFAVTMEQRGDDELVTCYDIATGDLRWSHAEKTRHESIMGGIGPRSTPTIHKGRVYALGATGRLVCLDGATGKLIWKFDLLSELKLTPEKDMAGVAWGRANSPLIVDDKVIVPMGGPLVGPSSDSPPKFVSLVALDRKTGEKAWSGGESQVSYSSPVEFTLAGRRQIVIVNEATVAGHDPTTGRELWSHPWPGGSASSASASQPRFLADDQLLLSKAYGTGAAVIRIVGDGGDKLKVEKVWENNRVLKTKLANVTTYQGHAYGLSDGILECVDLATGKSKWKRGRYEHGQLLRVGDCLLVLSEAGELLLIDASPEGHRELGKIPLIEGKTWNNLCMFGSILLARNG